MQTFELLEASVPLLAISGLAGLALGLGVYLVSSRIRSTPARLARGAMIGDAHRRARRERQGGLAGSVMTLAPMVGPLTRKLPLDSLRASLAERYAQAGWPGGLTTTSCSVWPCSAGWPSRFRSSSRSASPGR